MSNNEAWGINIFGVPTGGSFDLTMLLNGVSDTVTIAYNSTAAQAQTAIEGHAQVDAGEISVSGGDLPESRLILGFDGKFQTTPIDPPKIDHSGLTGPKSYGVIVERLAAGTT